MINDIPNLNLTSDNFSYADDLTLKRSGQSLSSIIHDMQNDLKKLENYTKENYLIINPTKTKAMIIYPSNYEKNNSLEHNLYLTINDQNIEFIHSFKFLGFILDDELLFEQQINMILSKLSLAGSTIRRCRYFLDRATLKLLFNCIGLPFILYSAFLT